jgi:hypothetical protein
MSIVDKYPDEYRPYQGDTDTNEEYFNSAFDDGKIVCAAWFITHTAMTQDERHAGNYNEDTCSKRNVAAYPDPDTTGNYMKHTKNEYCVKNYHRDK